MHSLVPFDSVGVKYPSGHPSWSCAVCFRTKLSNCAAFFLNCARNLLSSAFRTFCNLALILRNWFMATETSCEISEASSFENFRQRTLRLVRIRVTWEFNFLTVASSATKVRIESVIFSPSFLGIWMLSKNDLRPHINIIYEEVMIKRDQIWIPTR